MLEMLWKFVFRQFVKSTFRFRWKIWEFILLKLNLGWDPHVDAIQRRILKHQTEVDNNSRWLVPVSFLTFALDYWYLNLMVYCSKFLRSKHNFLLLYSLPPIKNENCETTFLLLFFTNHHDVTTLKIFLLPWHHPADCFIFFSSSLW